MPSKTRGRNQGYGGDLRKARSRLKSLGIFTDRVDLRRKITPYQKSVINKFADLLRGKASAVKATPEVARSYAKTFPTTRAGLVIVPRRTGEKISFDKERGQIKSVQKTRTGTIKRRYIQGEPKHTGEKLPKVPGAKKYYWMPFARGRNPDGTSIVDWRRFDDLDQLKLNMDAFYGADSVRPYENWEKFYVVSEYTPNSARLARSKKFGRVISRGVESM